MDENGKTTPNPIEPDNFGNVFGQARDYIPRAIFFYRILDPTTKLRDNQSQTNRPLAWEVLGVPPVALLEKCLIDGYPFIFGVQLYYAACLQDADYQSDDKVARKRNIDANGISNKPPTDAAELSKEDGGHAMLAIGFDSSDPSNKRFLIQNSWGSNWPKSMPEDKRSGRFWMPYEWFEGKHVQDVWVIKCGDKKFDPKSVTFNPAHWRYENLK